LLRGAECFDLCGENVTRHDGYFRVEVMTAKNHLKGLGFKVSIDSSGERPYCVGGFMEEFIKVMGIKLGVKESFFPCKLVRVRGGKLAADSSAKVASSTMRNCCKSLITASGLNALEYATHSSKHGGTLEAMRAGLSDAQIQELGRWSSLTMVARYAGGDRTRGTRWQTRFVFKGGSVGGAVLLGRDLMVK
jgi:hypothetical protein